MIRVNDYPGILAHRGLFSFLTLRFLYPNIYQAKSLEDFFTSLDDIKPSSVINPFMRRGALIAFENMGLRKERMGYQLYDITSSLDVGEYPPGANPSGLRENIVDGEHHLLSIAYFPRTKFSYLVAAVKEGDKSCEKSDEKVLRAAFGCAG